MNQKSMSKAATKSKRKPREVQTADSITDDELLNRTAPKLTSKGVYKGILYKKPISILIRFEEEDHTRGIKLMNRFSHTFTRVVNDALKEYLTKHNV